ncbi:HAD family hydrolase [Granulosicoccus antarcticus]|uniref:Alpha-D-glucose 1-phosphate phosphatase YihX n=1 Tax=Granulosicoccus antarcticus IMCC3135 TaxID=1192854 RepID=A0A2Z2P2E9_9GAMM|nr:HAD family phosphatase [Granulosicoccus antarcticus]ASJ74727.1 Alpha-D-glucose 1-phosphate phosphatase YihX [Granulosicoccus antarcticus IMCC3135]
MLNNLILDIGNVICDWNPDGLVASAFQVPAEQQEALSVTVGNPDWLALDRGTISVEQAIERAQARTSLNPEGIARIYANLCTSLLALPNTMEAMHRAKAQGVPVYILSNMQDHAWKYLESTFDCWDACEGVVVSCEAGLIKPDPAIYQHLCEKFAVTPQSCVFVDDMAENIEAAKAFGMQGVQLTDKHAGGQLIDELIARIVAGRN